MTKRQTRPRLIWLSTCNCTHCKGRASVCMAAFEWINKRDPNHALRHAKEDLIHYFDKLPHEVQDALNKADVNTCAWCAQIWTEQYGVAKAIKLIGDVRFVDAARAVTPLGGWSSVRTVQQKGSKT